MIVNEGNVTVNEINEVRETKVRQSVRKMRYFRIEESGDESR